MTISKNIKENLLILDSETGGIGLDKSLLTFYFLITNQEFNTIDELELNLKPNDDIYHLTAKALEINA